MLPILFFIAAVSCYGSALHAALYGHYGYALGLFSGGCAFLTLRVICDVRLVRLPWRNHHA